MQRASQGSSNISSNISRHRSSSSRRSRRRWRWHNRTKDQNLSVSLRVIRAPLLTQHAATNRFERRVGLKTKVKPRAAKTRRAKSSIRRNQTRSAQQR